MKPTADIYDELGEDVQSCTTQFRNFGAREAFEGTITTISCDNDNVLVKEAVREPGLGRVLVVDGQGSLDGAIMGDRMAAVAAENGWEGIIINSVIRDVSAL